MKPHIIIFRFIILIALLCTAICLSGCVSGMILMTRKNEASIFSRENAAKLYIEKHLGKPVSVLKYEQSITIDDVRTINSDVLSTAHEYSGTLIAGRDDKCIYRELFLNGWYFQGEPGSPPKGAPIVECVTYAYRGRIIPKGMIHERMEMWGYSFMLSEIVTTPAALVTVTTGWRINNIFKVYYDGSGHAWAYTWDIVK
ncbi:hypothetical protein M2447_002509 [Ereboglobus sp. PH5-10]|uniref:hypothetical protein n=1 Tax=Ereboglobus sp. PH5-10 TaxID=2940629 RepID=UPI0024057491|nr:hypothetical protein [Ereboglobus sp. PH5-10]MDF9828390.1 hypothetical protein [Ereboglobus sp. PH5-10]